MKRPIKIHKHVSGKLYIKGNKGNIFINSDIALHRLQARAVKIYKRNRKRIKREPATKKLYTLVNIGQPLFDGKQPTIGKDPLYMTNEEKAQAKEQVKQVQQTQEPQKQVQQEPQKQVQQTQQTQTKPFIIDTTELDRLQKDNEILTQRTNIFMADIEALQTESRIRERDMNMLQMQNDIKARIIDDYKTDIDALQRQPRQPRYKPPDQQRYEAQKIAELEAEAVADFETEFKPTRLIKPKNMTENVDWRKLTKEQKMDYIAKYTPAPAPEPDARSADFVDEPAEPKVGQGFVSMKPTDFLDSGLYEDDIEEILKQRDLIKCKVIARDEIDTLPKDTKYFVMNMSKRSETGTHWVAVYMDEYNVCYFNCLGDPPTNSLRHELISINPETQYLRKFKYNMKQIEPNTEDNCGYHCIMFLENMLNGCSFKEATQFTNDDVVKLEHEIDWV